MWAVVGKFGLEPGLSAVGACLLSVRRADRDVQGGVRVAKGGGEDVSRPEISAMDEAQKLGLGGVVAGLGAAGGVAGACVQGSVWQAAQILVRRACRIQGASGPRQRTPRAPARGPGGR